ncbi:MAG: hypothetical protein RQ757_09160 [Pseudomonadales bacterium]|nr:hypothetical protein [Pseudomonadales bacterium]
MTPSSPAPKQQTGTSWYQRLINQRHGLAITYWTLFLAGAVLFFIFGSLAVAAGQWQRFIILLSASVVYTFLLLIGVGKGYRGDDPGKALGRVTVLFLLLNLTNTLAVLSFI